MQKSKLAWLKRHPLHIIEHFMVDQSFVPFNEANICLPGFCHGMGYNLAISRFNISIVLPCLSHSLDRLRLQHLFPVYILIITPYLSPTHSLRLQDVDSSVRQY